MPDDDGPALCLSRPGLDSALNPTTRSVAKCSLPLRDKHKVCSWGGMVFWDRPQSSYPPGSLEEQEAQS